MARQVGPVFATGTIDGIVFYKLGDQYYMRSKGVYKSGKQMRKDPRLQRTMQKADQFRVAVKLLKPLYYRHLPRAVRKYGLFGQLTGLVNSWLQQGKSREEARDLLLLHLQTLLPKAATVVATPIECAPPGKEPEQAIPVAEATIVKPEAIKPPVRVKQARYLSSWKVKRNGRLHIPKPVTSVYLPDLAPFNNTISYINLSQEKNE